jgi:hypothetical protein
MSEIINWLRSPHYWLWVDIGQNKYEGPLLGVRVLLSKKDADAYVAQEMDEYTDDEYSLVKVKTTDQMISNQFVSKFINGQLPKDKIINFQRYRYRKGERYLTTSYLFEVKA